MPRNWSPWTRRPTSPACGWRSRWRRRAPCIPISRRSRRTPRADAQLLKRIADWCRRYTPLAALDPPDGVLLDIAGCAHLFSGEAALIEDLVDARYRLRLCRPRRRRRQRRRRLGGGALCRRARVAPGGERAALAPLPLKALRVDPRRPRRACAASASSAWAIFSTWRVRRSPPASAPICCASSTARWGASASPCSRGARSRPMSPSSPSPSRSRAKRTCWPRPSGWRSGSRRCWSARGEGMRRLELELFRTDGQVCASVPAPRARSATRARCARCSASGWRLLADPLDPGFGFDLARLNVVVRRALPAATGRAGRCAR